MNLSKDIFYSLESCSMPSILLGDATLVEVHGRGSIDVIKGTFHDVFCVPSLSTNLLSIY